MSLSQDESVKITNGFKQKDRSAVMNYLTHHYSIPEFDAEDIVQDAWEVLLNKLTVGELTDVPEKLHAYLATVCIHKAHEYLRKKEYVIQNLSFDDDELTAEEITKYEMEVQSWAEFIEESDRIEQRRMEAMEKAISKLNPRQRALLTGYYLGDDKSLRELARELGYSGEDVAKQTLARVRKSVRTDIQQQEGAHGNGLSPAAFFCPYSSLVDFRYAWKDGRDSRYLASERCMSAWTGSFDISIDCCSAASLSSTLPMAA